MRLKSLQMQGFKSFPEKTTLDFENGITSIVGPNGSGKSNIADAICWVLGEQSTKNLRGKKMEDVIFSGSKGRNSSGACFVAINFENKDRFLPVDSDEVSIVRKLYRSGESEYKINKKPAKLREINEIFMDTGIGRDGYSIIGQGKIADIVGAKTRERREIFEEAAGISRFRYRKTEAEKRLEDTYENTIRLKDILFELEDRVAPLKLQAMKAEKFVELATNKKSLEVSLWVHQINIIAKKLDKLKASLISEQNNLSDIEAILSDKEKQIEAYYMRIQKCIADVDKKRRESEQLRQDIARIDASVAVFNNELEHNSKNITEIESEIQKTKGQKEELNERYEKQKAEVINAFENLEQISRIKSEMQERLARKREEAEDISAKLETILREKNSFESEIANQRLLGASSKTLIKETENRLGYYDELEVSQKKELEQAQNEYEDCKKLISEIEKSMGDTKNEADAYKIKLSSATKSLEQKTRAKDALVNSKNAVYQKVKILEELERNMDGVGYSVKHIIEKANVGILSGVFGTVASRINVEKKYATAIEIALGKRAENIIVDNEQTAKDCINLLKHDRAGRATFLPLTTIKPQYLRTSSIEQEDGYIGSADKLVGCEPEYRAIIENLLGRIVVVKDIDCASEIAKKNGFSFKIVTLDGDVLNPGGSFTGGSVSKKTGLLTRRAEILRQNKDLEKLEKEIEKSTPEIEKSLADVKKFEAKIDALENTQRSQTEEKITYNAELKRLFAGVDNIKLAIKNLSEQKSDTGKKIELLKGQNTSYEDVIAKLSESVKSFAQKLGEEQKKKINLDSSLKTLEEEYTKQRFQQVSAQKDYEIMLSQLQRSSEDTLKLGETQSEVAKKLENIKTQSENIKAKNTQMLKTKKEYDEKLGVLSEDILKLINEQNTLEEKSTQLRNSEKEFIAKREKASGVVIALEDKKIAVQKSYDEIIAKLWDEYGLVKSEACEMAEPILDINLSERKLREIKQEIKSLGNVNVAALEEYKEVYARYEFMKAQLDDIEKSRQELKKMISDITSDMKEQFLDNFRKISENFSQVFTQLFGGGTARLELTEPDEVLESGIEILVEPPGKIIKNIALLSGGEQAFVAIAIYFAILKVRPTPFCVLDEIEAALDEVNVIKYANYLQMYKHNTQFIAITHRRGTMESADLLYGVTMQQEGISKVLKLELRDVKKM